MKNPLKNPHLPAHAAVAMMKAEPWLTWHWRIKKVGLTQESFLAMAGIESTQASFSRWVRGVHKPSDEVVVKIEQALKGLGV